ncbi:MAG: 50S ribosomal protein L35 [Armatimonadetes bacterium RBG_16_58_9]|nr:MAG: 50S ribosomal protein L35 [Armatimonadetes bacterium RBG_16_58_9]
MPKLKTSKTAAKRFEITAGGKIRRGNTGMNHLKMRKPKNAKRRLSMKSEVSSAEKRTIRRMVPGL